MKTRKLIKGMMAVAIVAVAGLAIYANQSKEHKSDVMLANIEALASGENTNCDFQNGYTAFTSKSGGAYDCCRKWVSNAPNTNEGRCH